MKTMKFRQAELDEEKNLVGWRYWGLFDDGWHPPSIGFNWNRYKALTPTELETLSFMWTGKKSQDGVDVYCGDIVTAIIPHQGGIVKHLIVIYDYDECGFVYLDFEGDLVPVSECGHFATYNIGQTIITTVEGNIIENKSILETIVQSLEEQE